MIVFVMFCLAFLGGIFLLTAVALYNKIAGGEESLTGVPEIGMFKAMIVNFVPVVISLAFMAFAAQLWTRGASSFFRRASSPSKPLPAEFLFLAWLMLFVLVTPFVMPWLLKVCLPANLARSGLLTLLWVLIAVAALTPGVLLAQLAIDQVNIRQYLPE